MTRYRQDEAQISDGVNLLVSILVRYPEIGTIRFEPCQDSINMTFVLRSIPEQAEFMALRQIVCSSILSYHVLEGFRAQTIEMEMSTYENVAFINLIRDTATLSKSEIALVVTLLCEQFKDALVTDRNECMLEEEFLIQEDVIDNMIDNIQHSRGNGPLIGIREDGRVLVYNK